MKKHLFIALSLACVHLHAGHFQNSIVVTAQNNDEYLVEMKIEKVVGQESELIAIPALRCVGNQPAELVCGTEEAGYLIKAQISQTRNEKKLHTSISIKENGQIVDSSEQIIKFIN